VELGDLIEVGPGEAGEDEAARQAVAWFDRWLPQAPEQWWMWHRLRPDPEDPGLLRIVPLAEPDP